MLAVTTDAGGNDRSKKFESVTCHLSWHRSPFWRQALRRRNTTIVRWRLPPWTELRTFRGLDPGFAKVRWGHTRWL